MKKRQYIILVGLAILVLSVFGMRYLKSLKEASARKAPPPTIRSIEYEVVTNKSQQAKIAVTGKTVAKNRIEIYAEVTGNLMPSSSKFKVGNSFNSGEVLLRIDNTEMSLSLQSAKSNFLSVLTRVLPDLKLDYPSAYEAWQQYTESFSVNEALQEIPSISGKEKYFLSTQGVFNQYYTLKSQEVKLSKFTITAPYSGTVSESLVNPGTLIRAGQKLGSFIKSGLYELEFSVDLNQLPFLSLGSNAVLYSNQIDGEFKGKVIRISDALDPSTQSAKVIVEVSDNNLKEGMYLTGSILTQAFNDVFILSKSQVNEMNQVFVVNNGTVSARTIKPLFIGENEIITDDLKNGEKIMTTLFDGVQDGVRVNIQESDIEREAKTVNNK